MHNVVNMHSCNRQYMIYIVFGNLFMAWVFPGFGYIAWFGELINANKYINIWAWNLWYVVCIRKHMFVFISKYLWKSLLMLPDYFKEMKKTRYSKITKRKDDIIYYATYYFKHIVSTTHCYRWYSVLLSQIIYQFSIIHHDPSYLN